MAGTTWRINIHKVGEQWLIDKPRGRPNRGVDFVEWTLHGDKGSDVSAHFQFPAMDLFENVTGRTDLTQDMTAEIPEVGGKLTLKVQGDACRRKNPRYYAVWIRDETQRFGGVYAVGEDGNPPPEIDVGP